LRSSTTKFHVFSKGIIEARESIREEQQRFLRKISSIFPVSRRGNMEVKLSIEEVIQSNVNSQKLQLELLEETCFSFQL